MGKVFSDISWANGHGEVAITLMQDVREVLKHCHERRKSGIRSHNEGLGQLECSLPTVLVQEAKFKGIDLHNHKERRAYVKWLKDRYDWDFSTVSIHSGKSGHIIIR